MSRWGSW